MITFSPAVVAMRAASNLLAMPPLLSPVALSRTRPHTDSSKCGTGGNNFRIRIGRVAVKQTIDVG